MQKEMRHHNTAVTATLSTSVLAVSGRRAARDNPAQHCKVAACFHQDWCASVAVAALQVSTLHVRVQRVVGSMEPQAPKGTLHVLECVCYA